MPDNKRILITGNNGYIGSVMAPWLQGQGFDVIGLDTGYFSACTLVPDRAVVPTVRADLRDVTAKELAGFDAVIHLAALSNDPIGNLNTAWTREINSQGTIRLATLAKQAGIPRFILSSSCIMYGTSEAAVVDENSPLAPRTEYARSKVEAEMALRALADDRFSPTFCRNGTVYGLSPRMRFDTVLNDFMGNAFTTGRIVIHSDGTPWRPVVHVQDVARAFQAVLEAPLETIHNEAFNIGAEEINYQIRDLGRIAAESVPGCELASVPQPGADQRTYKADFAKFKRTFPGFSFRWTAKDGAKELYAAFQEIGLKHSLFTDKRFTRLSWLRHLIDSKSIDESLRWTEVRADASRNRAKVSTG
ncbi:NAD-dependent dehydratase [Bradyrhizobium macuxiense]|uniref:NAD-dependent dehydratase n=1 Tax=Bradyrhizobium macuxiense TaxID=1755647 RepID=A0A109JF25_9BRAD|nr:SDR family oxidoreductase [Bradyrhizobium macuxiense]KWV47680.1 NAD-dependent dehydratase [Bradyrhizobium macuxiense]